ncbi:hypothetical protein [Streptomyces sp. NPDC058108]|uniref:hypothetical protein n=1 Tax=Streptomyces sp. NPDC058108 TaxID=3346344 RepID=UPI0036E6C909
MGGSEIESYTLGAIGADAGERRKAAVRIADKVAARHPHPLDERHPALAGAAIAKDPAVHGELLDLLAALGLTKTKPRRRK